MILEVFNLKSLIKNQKSYDKQAPSYQKHFSSS